jgi:hypothetical protein
VTVKPVIKENLIEAALRRRVRALGGLCEKVTVVGKRGFFDRLVTLPGNRILFAECKRPRRGRMSGHQLDRHAEYKKRGAWVEIILTLEDIDRLLPAKNEAPQQ